MKKYENKQTGLTITVEGPVVCVSEPEQETQKMHFGSAEIAEEIARDCAAVLRAVEVQKGKAA